MQACQSSCGATTTTFPLRDAFGLQGNGKVFHEVIQRPINQTAVYLIARYSLYVWRNMAHDDLRVEWIRQRVCAGFRLQQSLCFDELLGRDDGKDEESIIAFLNVVSQEDRPLCLLFFKTVTEEDVEVEMPVSKSGSLLFCEHPSNTVWKVIPARCHKRKGDKISWNCVLISPNNDLSVIPRDTKSFVSLSI